MYIANAINLKLSPFKVLFTGKFVQFPDIVSLVFNLSFVWIRYFAAQKESVDTTQLLFEIWTYLCTKMLLLFVISL